MHLTAPFVALTAAAAASAPAPLDEPGAARLDLVADAQRVQLRLSLPQDTLVGFAGAPRDDAERAAAADALARIGAAARVLAIDPAAGCGAARVEIDAGPLQAEAARPVDVAAPGRAAGRAVVARYEFDCAAAGAAAFVDSPLLQQFPRLRLVHVTMATPRGADRALLSRPLTRVTLR